MLGQGTGQCLTLVCMLALDLFLMARQYCLRATPGQETWINSQLRYQDLYRYLGTQSTSTSTVSEFRGGPPFHTSNN